MFLLAYLPSALQPLPVLILLTCAWVFKSPRPRFGVPCGGSDVSGIQSRHTAAGLQPALIIVSAQHRIPGSCSQSSCSSTHLCMGMGTQKPSVQVWSCLQASLTLPFCPCHSASLKVHVLRCQGLWWPSKQSCSTVSSAQLSVCGSLTLLLVRIVRVLQDALRPDKSSTTHFGLPAVVRGPSLWAASICLGSLLG